MKQRAVENPVERPGFLLSGLHRAWKNGLPVALTGLEIADDGESIGRGTGRNGSWKSGFYGWWWGFSCRSRGVFQGSCRMFRLERVCLERVFSFVISVLSGGVPSVPSSKPTL